MIRTYATPLLSCLVFAMLSLPAGCTKNNEAKAPPKERTINVRIQPSAKQELRPFIEATGTLTAWDQVVVSAEIDGIIRNLAVEEGTAVAKGTLLATIDEVDYALELKRAEAAIRQAEATLQNIKLEQGRKETLHQKGYIARQDADDVSARFSVAEAEVEKTKLAKSLAEQKLSRTKLYSPLAGMVKEKKAAKGDFIKNGTPILTLIQVNPLKLAFSVPEKDVGRLVKGQQVSFSLEAMPGRTFSGTVTTLFPSLDEKTRTLQVEAQAPNPGALLKPGLFARVTLYTGASRPLVLVPAVSLLYEGEQTRVFVVEEERARERIVKIGQKYGQKYEEMSEIIEGVKEGEQVVIVGQQNLHDGVKVHVAR